MSQEMLEILVRGLLLFGLWWLWFIEYRQFRIDLLRQRLFSIRDELLNDAMNGELSVESKAYGMTRTTLNGMIRFAHDLSILRIVIGSVIHRRMDRSAFAKRYAEEMKEAIGELPSEAKKRLLSAHLKMHFAVADHLIRSSLLLWMPLLVLMPILTARRKLTLVKTRFLRGKRSRKAWARWVDAEANEIGGESAAHAC